MEKQKASKESIQPRVNNAKGSNERMPKSQMPEDAKACKGCKSKNCK